MFQHVPTEGLVCLEALPIEAPDGVVLWKAPESTGQVITMHGSHLIAWDADHKRLELIDSARGHIIDSMTLPQVDRVIATSTTSGDIFASSSDGRLVRLVPRN